jgi:serine phosphatase RsbU (regulator of sigma subunit)
MAVTGFLVLVQAVVLLAIGVAVASRSRASRAPHGRRLIAIAALLVVQAALLYLFTFRVAPADWFGRSGSFFGVVWLTQAARAAVLFAAFWLWMGLIRRELTSRLRWAALVVALLALSWGGGAVGYLVIGLLASRLTWPGELSGWRRALTLLAAPTLFLLLVVAPTASVSGGEDLGVTASVSTSRPDGGGALLTGSSTGAERIELELARPLDRAVRGLVALFRVQLAVLTFQMLMMPIRLSGMSLKRRFMVNYVLVRQIPGTLGLITLVLSAYLAFGVMKTQQARAGLEQTLARGGAAAAALLGDPRLARNGVDAAERLDAARAWLGPDSSRANVLLRSWDASSARDTSVADSLARAAPVLAASTGSPDSLASAVLPRTRDGRFAGVTEVGDEIYLVSRAVSDAPEADRAVEVFVRVDSLYLAEIAQATGTRVEMEISPGVRVVAQGITFTSDSSSSLRAVAARSAVADTARSARTFWLARSFLPYGDWRSGWSEDLRGAVTIELHTTWRLLLRNAADVPAWLFTNVFTVGLIVGLTILIGMTESLAVRSGRTIVQGVEEEVGALRAATERFGAGDLSHRVPVRGKDELSLLAGSFNEMAANLERQRAELIEKERIEEDLEVARQIQRRFLPQRPPSTPGLDVAGLSMPSKEVGGDLFYYVELPDDRLAVALGDVSGKSVPAALLMSNVMSALRAESQHETAVERSLERINRLIVEQIEPGRFVTLFYGVIDPAGAAVRYTSAGHNPVLRITASGETRWLSEGGVPLGVLPDARYPAADEPLLPGDIVVIYSDGVTEAEGNPGGGEVELFGEDRLVEVVRALRAQPAEAIVQGIVSAVQAFAAGRPQADDVTLVVARRV